MFSWTRLLDNVTVGNMSSLTVSVDGADDGGMYRCDVINPAGSGSFVITVNGENGDDCVHQIVLHCWELFITMIMTLTEVGL